MIFIDSIKSVILNFYRQSMRHTYSIHISVAIICAQFVDEEVVVEYAAAKCFWQFKAYLIVTIMARAVSYVADDESLNVISLLRKKATPTFSPSTYFVIAMRTEYLLNSNVVL